MSKKLLFQTNNSLLKAETADYIEIEGLASTEDVDLQNEIIRQEGLDLSSLSDRKMVFNDDHSSETKDIIGIVDEAKVTKDGLRVKGKIFKNNPAGLAYYNLIKHDGYVGFSVQGNVQDRDSFNKNIVRQAKITEIALTRNPINQNTYAKFAKSLSGIIDSDIIKGGIGSGRKPGTKTAAEEAEEKMELQRKEKPKEVIIAEKKEEKKVGAEGKEDKRKEPHPLKEKDTSKQAEQKLKQESQKEEHGKKDIKDIQFKEREIKRRLQEMAAEGAKSPAEAKKLKQEMKEIGITGRKLKTVESRKVKIKKSELIKELVRRSKESEEFKKSLQAMIKSLSSGGAAYSNTLPQNMSNGEALQVESLDTDKKKKKKKDSK